MARKMDAQTTPQDRASESERPFAAAHGYTPLNLERPAESGESSGLAGAGGVRGYCCIALDNPKTDINIGSALRAAGIYGARMVVASGARYSKAPTDTMRAHRHLPLISVEDVFSVLPFDCVPVAIELLPSAIALPEYKHPERAFYVFGGEDATLGQRVLSRCRDVVYVPTTGCMNLAATVNVVLYDRLAKEFRSGRRGRGAVREDADGTTREGYNHRLDHTIK